MTTCLSLPSIVADVLVIALAMLVVLAACAMLATWAAHLEDKAERRRRRF